MKYIFSCGGTTIEGQAAKKWSQLQPGPYSWDDSRLAKKNGSGAFAWLGSIYIRAA